MRLRRKTYAQEERRAFVRGGILREGRYVSVQEATYASKRKDMSPRRRVYTREGEHMHIGTLFLPSLTRSYLRHTRPSSEVQQHEFTHPPLSVHH